jgi:hypothetical protein
MWCRGGRENNTNNDYSITMAKIWMKLKLEQENKEGLGSIKQPLNFNFTKKSIQQFNYQRNINNLNLFSTNQTNVLPHIQFKITLTKNERT